LGAQPTFLPISFLEVGLQRARSVVLVKTLAGTGTGLLTQNDLLITNHHVIPDAKAASETRVWFDYQNTADGRERSVSEFTLQPEHAFATSPADDWTAVQIDGNPSARWEGLELGDASVGVNDFVNIVQHPGGLQKQIALYHNAVAYVDETRVQYLTDTMPGSSGSPVFDSQWRVVALHHSGGWIPEPGTQRVFFRNEGIHVRALRRGLLAAGLLQT